MPRMTGSCTFTPWSRKFKWSSLHPAPRECMTILDKENKIAGDMMDLMTGKAVQIRMDHGGPCDLHTEKSGGLSR